MSQQAGMGAPSQILRLDEWVTSEFGLDGWWTTYQFDSAVTFWGNWVESKLNERDKNHHAVYTLDMLISDNPRQTQAEAFFGAFERVLKR